MKTIALSALAAILLTSAASAAPLNPAAIGSSEVAATEQVRLVCNEYGRCFRTGPRYVQRYYGGDDVVVRRSHGYYRGPGYYEHEYRERGPGVSFGFGYRD
jgi:hypothetical protein